MAIDVHAHYYPPVFMDAVRKLVDEPGEVGEVARRSVDSPMRRDPIFTGALDERLALMDAAGIHTHVISFNTPNVYHPDVAVRSDLARVFNDEIAALGQTYPGRFALFATTPLPFVDAAIAEAERALDTLGAVGIVIPTHINGQPIDAPWLDPFYAYLNQRGATVFYHPDGFCAPGALDQHGMNWSIGAMFEDTIVIIRLIYSGLVERYPRINWIVPHLGGTIPFLSGRIDRTWNEARHRNAPGLPPEPPMSYLSRIYFDIVTYQANTIGMAREVLGVERMVYGSDFPYASRQDLATGEKRLREAGFSEAEIAGVMAGHIAPVLGLEARWTPRR